MPLPPTPDAGARHRAPSARVGEWDVAPTSLRVQGQPSPLLTFHRGRSFCPHRPPCVAPSTSALPSFLVPGPQGHSRRTWTVLIYAHEAREPQQWGSAALTDKFPIQRSR